MSLFCYSRVNTDKEKRKKERDSFLKLSVYNQNTGFWTKCWMLDISRTLSCKITLVHLSVFGPIAPPICLSLSFFKIRPLVFCDIVHNDSWPWYLVTDEARFLKKNFWDLIKPNRPKWGPKCGFPHFLEFWSLDFLEIACNDSLQ